MWGAMLGATPGPPPPHHHTHAHRCQTRVKPFHRWAGVQIKTGERRLRNHYPEVLGTDIAMVGGRSVVVRVGYSVHVRLATLLDVLCACKPGPPLRVIGARHDVHDGTAACGAGYSAVLLRWL